MGKLLTEFTVRILIVTFGAFITYWAYNLIAPRYLYFLPDVYHNIGFIDIWAILLVMRAVTSVIRTDYRIKDKE